MPKRNPPAYCHHKPSGQARVRIKGEDHYLGPYGAGSAESHRRYAKQHCEVTSIDFQHGIKHHGSVWL